MKILIALFCLAPTLALAFGDTYAAIAYSPSSGLWGTGSRQPTREAADQQALTNCYAPDCQVQVWARNACCSLTVGRNYDNRPPVYAWAYDNDLLGAQRQSLDQCFFRAQSCQPIASVCSN